MSIEWTAAEREAVTDICTHEGLGKACDRCRDTISDALTALAPFVAERERQAAARALYHASNVGERIGYVVLAERPTRNPQPGDPTHEYQPAGSVWSSREPVENHRAYCEMKAEADPKRYGDVRYVIAALTLEDQP